MKNRVESCYFHPRHFVGNNIEYRIGSSAGLARFKESQTFILNQLAFNPFHKFSRTSKEILLLTFDVWFDLLCELEQYFLINQKDINIEDIMDMGDRRRSYVFKTLKDSEILDDVFLNTFEEITDLVRLYYRDTLEDIVSSEVPPVSKFGAIVDLSIRCLNHVLYLTQELDIIFSNQTPIINLDPISCEIKFNGKNICYASERIKKFQEIRDFDEIIIKNYLELEQPFNKTDFHKNLESMGIKYTLI